MGWTYMPHEASVQLRPKVTENYLWNTRDELENALKEKYKMKVGWKRLERKNQELNKQLKEERLHYIEEKEWFCSEMAKSKRLILKLKELVPNLNRKTSHRVRPPPSTLNLYQGNDPSLQIVSLNTENARLRSIVSERDERNYELCLRFLRLRQCKNDLRERFRLLEEEYLKMISELMTKLDEARTEFNFIIDKKFQWPLHKNNASYLQLVKKTSRVDYENAALKLELQRLKKTLKLDGSSVSNLRMPRTVESDEADNVKNQDQEYGGK